MSDIWSEIAAPEPYAACDRCELARQRTGKVPLISYDIVQWRGLAG